MKKVYFVIISVLILSSLISCSRLDVEDANSTKSANYTITIKSPQGNSVLDVSENGTLNRSVYTDNFMQITTTRDYSYNANNELRSVEVSDNTFNSYSIIYGTETKNNYRSAIEDQETIPETVRYVYKTNIVGSRAASSDISNVEKIEYYYDDNGNIAGIMRIDGNGNVYVRDMEQ